MNIATIQWYFPVLPRGSSVYYTDLTSKNMCQKCWIKWNIMYHSENHQKWIRFIHLHILLFTHIYRYKTNKTASVLFVHVALICFVAHTTAFVTRVVEHWLEREIAQYVHHEGSLRRPIASWANALTTELTTYKHEFRFGIQAETNPCSHVYLQ